MRMVLARLDGTLDVADIAALTGLSEQAVEETLQPLIEVGILAVGDTAAPSPAPSAVLPRRPSGEFSMPPPDALPKISEDEAHRIQEFYSKLNKMDHYRLLGCAATADTKDIKRSYFALAKLYHPDRFFRKDVGALKPKIDAIFTAMTNALDTLTEADRRATYDAYLREVLKTRITRRNAEALEGRRDYVAAAEIWARVVESLPTDAYVHHRQAYALLRAGVNFDIAISAVSRAIELDPMRSEYRITAASLYIATGRDRMALGELDAACELEPDRQDYIGLRAAIGAKADAQRVRESIPG
jgi:tetratricopeptide (TPR) repeat protein